MVKSLVQREVEDLQIVNKGDFRFEPQRKYVDCMENCMYCRECSKT